ncbi:geranylgeranyl pyrophosphate synthase [Actinomycetota bacterium]|nr:geranylgeranyl pyrophosphate synthase [Actinomycetota bacterium]
MTGVGVRDDGGATTAVRTGPVQDPVTALGRGVDEAQARTRDLLTAYLAEREATAGVLAPAYAALWASLAGQVGGRMMRPRLTAAAYLGLGGHDLRALAPVAAAQEVLHTAMLVHDDLLDHDESRRGRPNVAGAARVRLTSAGLVGQAVEDQVLAAGVLGGDLALAAAFELLAAAPVHASVRVDLVRLLARGIGVTVAGELLDMAGELLGPAEVDALRIAELKTAVYSCCGPLTAGAVLAGAPAELLTGLGRYGAALGIAFQLLDDELGVFGDEAVTGKSVLSDLREGKRTELLRLTYRHTDAAGRRVLDANVGRRDLDLAGADAVRAVMVDSSGLSRVREVRARTVATARDHATTALPSPLADYLVCLVDELAGWEVGP